MFQIYDYYNQGFNIQPFLIKLKNNQLTLENILEEDEIINDIKFNTQSEFLNFLTEDKIKKLIDYSTKMPISNNHNIGFKYPFNATEILCSENAKFQDKFMVEKPFISKKELKEKLDQAKKIKKGGFISQLFKIMNKVKNNDINDDNIDMDDIDGEKEEIEIDDLSDEEINDFGNDKNIGKKIVYENVDYLLNFLKESEEVQENYVLVGYFYKILNSLINIQAMKIVKYLYDYPKKDEFDILNIFVKHMNRKSMCDIIRKLITFEDELMTKYDDKKLNLFEKILDELNICEDKDKYNCICDTLYLIMNNTKFFDLFLTKNNLIQKIYEILFNCAKNQNTKKYISILQLLIKINENILQRLDPHNNDGLNYNEVNEFLYGSNFPKEKSVSSQNENNENLKNFLAYLFDILEKNEFNFFSVITIGANPENEEFMATYMEKQKKIGLLKIKQTEFISTLIDVFVCCTYSLKSHEKKIEKLINILNSKRIFWDLHDMFFKYPHSNLYQILYKKIMEIVTNENAPKSLVEAFFFEKGQEKRNLIDIYIEKEISNEMKLNHPLTNMYTMNPCFAFLNSILYQIYTSKNNEIRKIIEENNDIHVFVEIMVEDFEQFFNYKLLYKDPLDALCSNVSTNEEQSPFGSKSMYEIFEENCEIYKKYKNGEDYKPLLEEKKKRLEQEKEEKDEQKKENENAENNKGIQYIDDLDDELEDEDPIFKVEKINLRNEKENFLAMLNKPTEEINKEKNNENENDNENNVYKGRFNIEDLDENEDEKDREKNNNDDNNNIEDINEENEKINDDSTPDIIGNKIYHVDYNKIEEKNKENLEKKEEDKKE